MVLGLGAHALVPVWRFPSAQAVHEGGGSGWAHGSSLSTPPTDREEILVNIQIWLGSEALVVTTLLDALADGMRNMPG